jgi:hypothetical protein
LYGLSPGRLLGGPSELSKLTDAAGMMGDDRSTSDAVKLWESLLEGPRGWLRIFRCASCVSDARLTGLSGADALPDSICDGRDELDVPPVAVDLEDTPESAGGAVLPRQKLGRAKRLPRFLAGDSIVM